MSTPELEFDLGPEGEFTQEELDAAADTFEYEADETEQQAGEQAAMPDAAAASNLPSRAVLPANPAPLSMPVGERVSVLTRTVGEQSGRINSTQAGVERLTRRVESEQAASQAHRQSMQKDLGALQKEMQGFKTEQQRQMRQQETMAAQMAMQSSMLKEALSHIKEMNRREPTEATSDATTTSGKQPDVKQPAEPADDKSRDRDIIVQEEVAIEVIDARKRNLKPYLSNLSGCALVVADKSNRRLAAVGRDQLSSVEVDRIWDLLLDDSKGLGPPITNPARLGSFKERLTNTQQQGSPDASGNQAAAPANPAGPSTSYQHDEKRSADDQGFRPAGNKRGKQQQGQGQQRQGQGPQRGGGWSPKQQQGGCAYVHTGAMPPNCTRERRPGSQEVPCRNCGLFTSSLWAAHMINECPNKQQR